MRLWILDVFALIVLNLILSGCEAESARRQTATASVESNGRDADNAPPAHASDALREKLTEPEVIRALQITHIDTIRFLNYSGAIGTKRYICKGDRFPS